MTIKNNITLSDILWYKIGGTAKYFLECKSKQDILDAFNFIQKEHIKKFFVVGLGANLLFTDDYFDGAVIQISTSSSRHPGLDPGSHKVSTDIDNIKVEGTKITAFAGELLDTVINTSFEHNLVGLEWAGGLPSTIGAAIRGNVGAFGHSIQETIKEVEVLNYSENGYTIETLDNNALDFSYRNSAVKQKRNLVVLSAIFTLKEGTLKEVDAAREIYNQNKEYRKKHHPDPLIHPNTGSTFKNVSKKEHVERVLEVFPDMRELVEKRWFGKVSVGYLNNKFGFSGFKIGGAQVSEKHNNFINNIDHAKAIDVESVIKTIQQKYQDVFGFMPEPEIEIVH